MERTEAGVRDDGEDISLVQEFCLLACLKKLSTQHGSKMPAIDTEGSTESKEKDNFTFPSFLKKGNFLQRWTKALKVTITPKERSPCGGALGCHLERRVNSVSSLCSLVPFTNTNTSDQSGVL